MKQKCPVIMIKVVEYIYCLCSNCSVQILFVLDKQLCVECVIFLAILLRFYLRVFLLDFFSQAFITSDAIVVYMV